MACADHSPDQEVWTYFIVAAVLEDVCEREVDRTAWHDDVRACAGSAISARLVSGFIVFRRPCLFSLVSPGAPKQIGASFSDPEIHNNCGLNCSGYGE